MSTAEKLARAIADLVKSGVAPSQRVAETSISILSQSKKSPLIQKILDVLSARVKGPPEIMTDPDSIGNAYFAGRKIGSVYGSPMNPYFKLKLNGSRKNSWKGWKLVPRPTVGNRMIFDFIKEGTVKSASQDNLAKKIISLLRNGTPSIAASQGRTGLGDSSQNFSKDGRVLYPLAVLLFTH
jgi:hypothetical protein